MNALRNYEGRCEFYQIACYVSDASGQEDGVKEGEEMNSSDSDKKTGPSYRYVGLSCIGGGSVWSNW